MAIGRNTLQAMVKQICSSAGIESETNHSLRATGATMLFDTNVSEKLIQEQLDIDRTFASLRLYECTSTLRFLCNFEVFQESPQLLIRRTHVLSSNGFNKKQNEALSKNMR